MKLKLLFAAMMLYAAGSAQNTVSSYPTLTSNNGTSGVTFQASVGTGIDILSLTATVTTGTRNVEIWYRPGGALHPSGTYPVISTANGWIQHEVVSVTSASTTVPTNIPLTVPLNLSPGITYGMYVGGNSSMRYMTYNSALASSFTDGTLTITTGVGSGWGGNIPNVTIATRSFVGSLTYLPVSTVKNDVGVASVDSPAGGCEGQYNVVVTVKNFGINQVDTLTVDWMFNNVLQTPVNYYQVLDTFNGIGSQTAQISLGSVSLTGGKADTIKAWTSMPNNVADRDSSNDTTEVIYNSLSTITSYPYVEDFESSQGEWFIDGSNPSWAWGTPAKTTITGASSGVNAFVTGGLGTGQYNASENSYVGSPCFDLSSFQGTPWVAMDVWWNSEFSWDGAVLQTSVDGGNSWVNVGANLDPNNWYNDNTINGNPGGQSEGWTGRVSSSNGSGGWKMAKHTLDASLVGQSVRFRVAFGADGSINDDGFAFDNFRLVDFVEADLGPDQISLCGTSGTTLDPGIILNGDIVWSTGDSTSSSIVVSSAGLYWVVYTDSLIDEKTSDSIQVIQSIPPAINFARLIDTVDVNGSITLDPNLPFNLQYTWTPTGLNFPFLLVKGSDYGLGSHVFNLQVVDSVLCEDNESVTVVFVDFTGIDENTENEFSIYPNPVSDRLNIVLHANANEKTEVSIYDLQGRRIFSGFFRPDGNSNISLDMNKVPAGNYILQVRSGERIYQQSIIKTK